MNANGDLTVNLRSDMAAESPAKSGYEYRMQFAEDPRVKESLGFLMTREIAHFQMFGAALESIAHNFPPRVLLGDPPSSRTYFNMSAAGDTRGPWNRGQGSWESGEEWVYSQEVKHSSPRAPAAGTLARPRRRAGGDNPRRRCNYSFGSPVFTLTMASLPSLLLLSAALYAQEWPMYMLDAAHSSYRPDETGINRDNVRRLRPLWAVSLGDVISAAPTISGGVAFVGAWNGNLYALDTGDGHVVWQRFLGKAAPAEDPVACLSGIGIAAQAAVIGDTVYAGGGDAAVYALDRNTGEIRWRLPLGDSATGAYLWSSVTFANNVLYVGLASLSDCPLARGGLARIDLNDPEHPLLRYLVPEDELGAGVWSTPAVDTAANLVYITTGNGDQQDASQQEWNSALLALDATTLEVKAYFFLPIPDGDADADWGSSPTLFNAPDGTPLVAASGKTGGLYALRRPDLAPVWSQAIAIDCMTPEDGCGSLSTPAFDGQVLYSGAGTTDANSPFQGTVYALDPQTGKVGWTYASYGVVIAPVTVAPGMVFVGSTAGLVVLDSGTGEQLWTDYSGGGLYSQPVLAGGVLYTTYMDGKVIAWRVPEPGRDLGL